ncbi:MAG TPA: pyruvate dehydrogenase complex E1 component subunit beta [Stellaceae bacterium]|nr:pyruvate dehydrogenase complex E1 component subunit beta [Stellaceae bacterium]
MRELSYNEAALEAIAEEMRRDPKIFYMSTDPIGPLLKEFGEQRVRATPIAEAAFTGIGIGAAGCGFRPIVDWRQVTFCFVAMDQIVNQAAKIHYMFGGQATFPMLFRAAVGGGTQLAAQHSQSPYSMFMNLAGLKMFLPSTPYDIKGLLKTAIRDNNPVISFESNRLMGRKGPVPEEDYTIPFGQADIKREGSDATVVALAWLVHEALAAAEELAKEGVSVEVVDPRSLVPLDAATIRASVRKTGRLVVADEAGPTAGVAAEIAAVVAEDPATFARLKAPVKRVCALQVPIPYSPVLEDQVFPDRRRIVAGIREVLDASVAAAGAPGAR